MPAGSSLCLSLHCGYIPASPPGLCILQGGDCVSFVPQHPAPGEGGREEGRKEGGQVCPAGAACTCEVTIYERKSVFGLHLCCPH